MEIELIEKFITEQALILIPTIYILGMFIKSVEFIPNRIIPIVLLCIAIILSMCLNGRGIHSLIQGILTAGVAVFFNQMYIQLFKKTD